MIIMLIARVFAHYLDLYIFGDRVVEFCVTVSLCAHTSDRFWKLCVVVKEVESHCRLICGTLLRGCQSVSLCLTVLQ